MKLTDDNLLVFTVTAKEELGEDDDATVTQRLPSLREARTAAETVLLFLEHSKRATSDDVNLSADLLRRVYAISEGEKTQVVITDFFKKMVPKCKKKVQLLSHIVANDKWLQWPLMKSFLAGAFSGTCSTLLFQPLDLVKTRIQNPTGYDQASWHGDTHVQCNQKRKFQGLWRGTIPSITRCVPGMGLYFSTLSFIESNLSPEEKPSPIKAMCYGFMARTFACTTLLPVTVIKTRFESGSYGYGSVSQALRVIYLNEGRRGLFSGLVPTLVRDVPFSGLYLLFYTQTKLLVPNEWRTNCQLPVVNLGCGLLAGGMASLATHPADVVKTRMQLCPGSSLSGTLTSVYHEHGVGGFFRGLAPRLVRRTMMTAMAWTIYEQNIDVGVSVHPKALLKEMGRHDITFTADNAKDHYGGRKFRVHHDRSYRSFISVEFDAFKNEN
ncbi:SLC25A38 [Cordylochernes scorpioides]|uniref:Mitochondrial glycine transporter n=1 Tax=Cordylochernes scorpioides TaxID=51811 RepID=A0ABY6JVX1_9ARAC|nr:SLC25A38 [Cordylochernes scorpioides]